MWYAIILARGTKSRRGYESMKAVCKASSEAAARTQIPKLYQQGWTIVNIICSDSQNAVLGKHASTAKQRSTKKGELIALRNSKRRQQRQEALDSQGKDDELRALEQEADRIRKEAIEAYCKEENLDPRQFRPCEAKEALDEED